MSKVIKLTEAQLAECRRDFDVALSTLKVYDGKISFIKTITCPNEKATLYFKPIAWRKMQKLVESFSTEVAWHGVAYRGEDETKNEYYITDILVYPQTVTGATVNTDQEKYEMWLMEHTDDVFNNIRMQGHSHVNMGVTPSGTDEAHQSKILEQLEDDMFYIFLIWNKRGDKTVRIYDFKKNILFETADVSVEVLDDGSGIDEFLKDAKSKVVEPPKTTTYYGSGYSSYYGSGYNSTYNKAEENYSKLYGSQEKETKKQTDNKIVTLDTAKTKQDFGNQYRKQGKRRGKRKKKDSIVNPSNAATNQLTMFDDGYDDDPFGYRDNFQW